MGHDVIFICGSSVVNNLFKMFTFIFMNENGL